MSVIASTLYRSLPAAPDIDLPGGGRKLLLFSDSRQDAAFFAPYLTRTYQRIIHRRLIVQALASYQQQYATEPAHVKGLVATPLRRAADEAGVFPHPHDIAEEQRKMSIWLFRELIGVERRIGLEGTGLLAVNYERPQDNAIRTLREPPWGLSADEEWQIIEALLDTLRERGVLVVEPADINDPDFAPFNRPTYVREVGRIERAGVHVFGWLPESTSTGKRRNNRRLDLLTRVFVRITGREPDPAEELQISEALRGIWRSLKESKVFSEQNLRNVGVVYRLSSEYLTLRPGDHDHVDWSQCDRCGNITSRHLPVCITYRCTGVPRQIDPAKTLQHNHYRIQYTKPEPIPLEAKEHTAQWSQEAAARVQQAFIDGATNVLSCSTTFELGVDVGELQAVLMRNVPPSTANYVQRAGLRRAPRSQPGNSPDLCTAAPTRSYALS